jgi:hypothetical protein
MTHGANPVRKGSVIFGPTETELATRFSGGESVLHVRQRARLVDSRDSSEPWKRRVPR